jgi:hypothetical protein
LFGAIVITCGFVAGALGVADLLLQLRPHVIVDLWRMRLADQHTMALLLGAPVNGEAAAKAFLVPAVERFAIGAALLWLGGRWFRDPR